VNPARPVNTSTVRDPKWTGKHGEAAIVVGRGEPRRNNTQMQQAVHGQVQRYLTEFTDMNTDDMVITLTTQLIAEDHINPAGTQMVALNREHLMLYADAAIKKLAELA
jgi:hypothetical protein